MDSQRARDRILLMLPRTEANGASPHEAEAAAKHIGQLLMQFPELLSGYSPRTDPLIEKTWSKCCWPGDDSEAVTVKHSGKRGESANSVLFIIRGTRVWLKKSQLRSYDADTVTMSEWIAIQKGLI